MEEISLVLSALILLTAFVLVASKRVRSYIGILQLQGALIALNTGLIGIQAIRLHGRFDVLIVSLIIVALKVFYIPRQLHKTCDNVEHQVSKDFFLNIPFLVAAVIPGNTGQPGALLVNAIALVLIGLFFIISRRKAIGQIVGLLVIENGLFVTAMYASDGMPFIVDMGIFIDLVTAVLILGVMVGRINAAFESIDTENMSNLRG
jgi:hydrogenase-4 component E